MNNMNHETDITKLVDQAINLGNKMKFDIIARHKSAGQYTTGKTSGMLQIEPTQRGFKLVGWSYSGVWEEGRQPNKRAWGTSGSKSTVWSESLIAWAKAKGLTFKTPEDAQRWAFCVMRKMAQSGSKMYREHRTEDVFTTPIADMQNALAESVGVFYSDQVWRRLLRIDIANDKNGTTLT